MKDLDIKDFLNEVKVAMKKKKITLKELNEETGVPMRTISFNLNGEGLGTLKKILKYVNEKEI